MEYLTTYLALVGFISFICQWLSWYIRIPAIVLLLFAGFLIKPVLNSIMPASVFDVLLFPFVSMAVAIILFEGALTLNFSQIKGLGRMIINLISTGVAITWVVVGVACHMIMDTSWMISMLFGALVVVTGPTVIMPMVRVIKPKKKLANILMWEGILIDPVGALLAVLVYEFIIKHDTLHAVSVYGAMIGLGTCLGVSGGWMLGQALKRHWFPQYLINVAVIAVMMSFYVLSNRLEPESGLLTVTVMGVMMANMDDVDVSGILEFKETLSVFLISGVFILLSARVELRDFLYLGWEILLLLSVILFVARPLTIWVSSLGTRDLSTKELMFLSWISPRGIVSASVATLFALNLESQNVEGAQLLVPLVFSVIITTVVLQSLTARWVAQTLGVRSMRHRRMLFFGAGAFSRKFAQVLQEQGMNVLLVDPNWVNISQARMDGLEVYFGNPTTEDAKMHIDFSSIGGVLVCSPYSQLNLLVTYFFEDLLDGKNIFHLTHLADKQSKKTISSTHDSRDLFDGASFNKLTSWIKQGSVIKATKITENYTFDMFQKQHQEPLIPLALIHNETCTIVKGLEQNSIVAGDVLVYLSCNNTSN
jgi:NhaP-type Na+/H+ or K+/H+ antiporter